MSRKFILLTAFLTLLMLGNAFAQDGFDPPEINGSHVQEYQELKIEITAIRRLQEYQAYFRDSDIPAGKKLVAGPDQEIALVQFHTERLGESPGIRLNGISIFDADGVEHNGSLGNAFIGTAGDRRAFHPKELDYEFPVLVPKGIVFSAVQLRTSIRRDSQPYSVTQKINFDISLFAARLDQPQSIFIKLPRALARGFRTDMHFRGLSHRKQGC